MKKFLNPKWIIISLFVIAICFYLAILIIAKQQLRGEQPDKKLFATIDKPVQRAHQQSCTGITITPHSTWLVSRDDSEYYTYDRPSHSFDLNSLLPSKEAKSKAESYFGFKEDKDITYISKLDQNGKFQEIARLNGTACLVSPPSGENILLLTDVETPYNIDEPHQFAVLRSDDQGETWQWQKEGFFMPVYFQAWTFNPTFYNSQNTWLWSEKSEDKEGHSIYLGHEAGKPSGLNFSSDLGKTIEKIQASAPILVQLKDIKHQAPKNIEFLNPELSDVKAYVTQWQDHQAILWVSQTYNYTSPYSNYIEGVRTTAKVKLQRVNDHWQMGEIQHIDGVAIENIVHTSNGQFIAIQSVDNQKQDQIAELEKSNLSWKVHGKLPQPFSPFNDSTSAQYVWATKNSLIISMVSNHQFYRILRPFKWFSSESAGDVSAFSTYASTDLGKSWHKLAIEAPNGVLGVNQKTNQIFWADGAWYSNKDLNIYADTLK